MPYDYFFGGKRPISDWRVKKAKKGKKKKGETKKPKKHSYKPWIRQDKDYVYFGKG